MSATNSSQESQKDEGIRSEESVLGERVERLKDDPEIDEDMDTLPDLKAPKDIFDGSC